MTRVILSIVLIASCVCMQAQQGWTLKSAVSDEMLSAKPLVDDVRALLPEGTYCTFSVKSQEIWVISDHSPEQRSAIVDHLNDHGHYVYQINFGDKAAQRQIQSDLKERYILDNQAEYDELNSRKVYMTQAEFSALPLKTQLKIAQSDNVIVQ